MTAADTERAKQAYIAWKRKTLEYNLRRAGMTHGDIPWIRKNSPKPR